MNPRQAYRKQLRSPLWQRRRLEIFERDNWTCQQCGARNRELQVHHRWYVPGTAPWEVPDKALITLCHICHKDIAMNNAEVTVLQKTMIPDTYGSLRCAHSSLGIWYFAKLDVEHIVIAHIKKTKGKEALLETIWTHYMLWDGGKEHRVLEEQALRKETDTLMTPPLEFTDDEGIIWIADILATHFISTYYPALQHSIHRHFAKTVIRQSENKSTCPEDEHIAAWEHIKAQRLAIEKIDKKVEKNHSEFTMFQGQVNGRIDDLETTVENIALAQEQAPLPPLYAPWFSVFHESYVPTNKPRLKNSPRGRFYDLCNQVAKKRGYGSCEERIRLGNSGPTKFWHEDILKEAKTLLDEETPRLFRFSA